MIVGHNVELLSIERGSVTAPAGCGKTQLIADALTSHEVEKPVLVLTHTNAGVAALRRRLNLAGVPAKAYRLSTIDGWILKLISTFPIRSAHNAQSLLLEQPRKDYPTIRATAVSLLKSGHIADILSASYERILVDEYQDCTIQQHAVVELAAQILPICVLGDPMQAIFGFGGDDLADWDEQICASFPCMAELETPWRWINDGEERLGRWLLEVREHLQRGTAIDLKHAPESVTWVEMDGIHDHERRLRAARVRPPGGHGGVLIIGDSTNPDSQRKFASQTPDAETVEAVDLRDFVNFARTLDLNTSDALKCLIDFAQQTMRKVGGGTLLKRVQSLLLGTARKPPSNVEKTAMEFARSPSHRLALDLLVEIGKQPGVSTHRPVVLRACKRALNLCETIDGLTFHEAAIRMREQNRNLGRELPRRAVGSTLLLKGLEAAVAVLINADDLDARNLYVAMTRGSRSLTVCSTSPILDRVA